MRVTHVVLRYWWLDDNIALWSREERRARLVLIFVAGVIFFPLYGIEILALNWIGVDQLLGALVGLFPLFPLSFYLSPKLSMRAWPELMKTAHENAAKRSARKN